MTNADLAALCSTMTGAQILTTRPKPHYPKEFLTVRAWRANSQRDSVDLNSVEIELNWLPVVGPTTLVLIRSLGRALAEAETFDLECRLWAKKLGVGNKGGYHSPFWRALMRAQRFEIVCLKGSGLLVKTQIPRNPRQQEMAKI